MKKLFILFAFIAVSVNAQVASFDWVPLNVPTTVAANFRTNLASPLFIDCSKQKDVALEFYFTGATNAFYYLAPTVSGSSSRMDTNNLKTIQIGNGSSPQTNFFITNYTVGGIQGFFLYGISNSTAVVMTNTVGYATKLYAP